MAILQMGNQHLRPILRNTRKGEVLNSGHRLLYKVYRSKAGSHNNGKPGQEICVGQHCMQIRTSRGNHISDNGKQFRDNPFKDWCEKLDIKQRFASVKHPQTNGQVERANRNLGEGIKARDTLFSITYDTEAMIPVEIGMPSLRCAKVNQTKNDEGILLNLDILEERRERAAVREARSKARMEKYYNAKVRNTSFRPGDFVYRNNEASHAKENEKLGPKWEGPYEVVEALGKGAYKLRNGSGDILPRTWNVKDLKKFYL
ncbi:reverse transcriptase domain-containing protein [Tanacetum coccineum]